MGSRKYLEKRKKEILEYLKEKKKDPNLSQKRLSRMEELAEWNNDWIDIFLIVAAEKYIIQD